MGKVYKKVECDLRFKYSQELRQEIFRLNVEEGVRKCDLAKKYDIPYDTICQIIKSLSLRKFGKEDIQDKRAKKNIEENAKLKSVATAIFDSLGPGNKVVILAKGRKRQIQVSGQIKQKNEHCIFVKVENRMICISDYHILTGERVIKAV